MCVCVCKIKKHMGLILVDDENNMIIVIIMMRKTETIVIQQRYYNIDNTHVCMFIYCVLWF